MAKWKASHSCLDGRNSRRESILSRTKVSEIRTLPIYFKAECQKDVVNALQSLENDIQCGGPILWEKILRVIGTMRTNKNMKPHSLKFLREVIQVLEKHKCNNLCVISKVFVVLFHFTLSGNPDAFIDSTSETLKLILHKDVLVSPDFDFSQFLCSPYEICPSGGNTFDILWNTALCGNLGLMKLELKFGVGMLVPQDQLNVCMVHLDEFMENFLEEEHYARMEEKLKCDFSSDSIKRFALILRMLKIAQKMKSKPELNSRLIQCYNLVFESIPEAYISTTEVEAYLTKCVPESIQHQREHFFTIRKFFEELCSMLPQIAEGPQPRSLKHLCRIQVRQVLRQNLNFPYGLSSLPLPELLKKYIMLNDDGDYSLILTSDSDSARGQEVQHVVFPARDDTMVSFFKSL